MLIQRYLSKQLFFSTLLIAIGLTMIIWLTQSLKLLDLVVNGGAPLHTFGYMLMLTVPKFFELILPMALAVSIVFLFNKLTADSELIVMQACGLSPWQIAKAIAALAVVVGCCVFLIGGWLTPKANLELDRLRTVAKSGFSVSLLRPGVFNTLGDNMVVYLNKRSTLGNLQGLLINITPDNQPSSTIWAKSGGIVMRDDHPIVVMKDGVKQQYNPRTEQVESLKFASYQVDLTGVMHKAIVDDKIDPDQYTLPDLYHQLPLQQDAKSQQEFRAEAAVRLSRPLLVISFALSAVTPFLLGRYNRRGQAWRILHVILGLVALQAAYLGSTSAAQHHSWGVLLLYAVAVAPSLVMLACLANVHPAGKWRMRMEHMVMPDACSGSLSMYPSLLLLYYIGRQFLLQFLMFISGLMVVVFVFDAVELIRRLSKYNNLSGDLVGDDGIVETAQPGPADHAVRHFVFMRVLFMAPDAQLRISLDPCRRHFGVAIFAGTDQCGSAAGVYQRHAA